MPTREVYTRNVRFEFELAGRSGELLTLYERGGENCSCVEGQTRTPQIEGRTCPCNSILNALHHVAQINRKYLNTKKGLAKAIEQYVILCYPPSFRFTAQQVGNPNRGEIFRGRARVSFPESPMRGKLDKLSFD
jgi:hypothetical protein